MKKFDPIIPKCKICGSNKLFKFHFTSDELIIYKCQNCRVQFLNPQYSNEYLEQLYSKYTIDQSGNNESLYRSHNDCLIMIEKFSKNKNNLFDIGSGNGHLISLAKKRGWDPIGYDVDCTTVSKIKSKLGIEILCGDFLNLNIPAEKYEVVTMLHVIEHLKEPILYLNKVKEILVPEGVLFLALPNIHSRSANLKLILEKLKIKRKNIGAYYDTGHHLWYFTPKTIRHILEKNGFNVKLIYSGSSSSVYQSKFKRTLSEKIISNIFWPSNMALIAIKK